MTMQPKNKILIITIGILLIANIVTLSLLLMHKNDRAKYGRPDKRAQLAVFLKDEIGFTEDQLSSFDTLSKAHKAKMKPGFDEIATGRETVFKQLAARSFSDSAIEIAANAIADQQKEFEKKMLRNLKEIRSICTPAQQVAFDSGFYKVIAKRGEGKKEK